MNSKNKLLHLTNFGIFLYYLLVMADRVTKTQTNVRLEMLNNLSNFNVVICKQIVEIYREQDYSVDCSDLTDDQCIQTIYNKPVNQIIQEIEHDYNFISIIKSPNIANLTILKVGIFNGAFCQHIPLIGNDFFLELVYLHKNIFYYFLPEQQVLTLLSKPYYPKDIQHGLSNSKYFIYFQMFKFTRLPFPYDSNCKHYFQWTCLNTCSSLLNPNEFLYLDSNQTSILSKTTNGHVYEEECLLNVCKQKSCNEFTVFPSYTEMLSHDQEYQDRNIFVKLDPKHLHFVEIPMVTSVIFVIYSISLVASFFSVNYLICAQQTLHWFYIISIQASNLLFKPRNYSTSLALIKKIGQFLIFITGSLLITLQAYSDVNDYFRLQTVTESVFYFPDDVFVFGLSTCDKIILVPEHEDKNLRNCLSERNNKNCINVEIPFKIMSNTSFFKTHNFEAYKVQKYYFNKQICHKYFLNRSEITHYALSNQQIGAIFYTGYNREYYLHDTNDFARLGSIKFENQNYNFIVRKEIRLPYPYGNCIVYKEKTNYKNSADCIEQCLLDLFQKQHGNSVYPSEISLTNLSKIKHVPGFAYKFNQFTREEKLNCKINFCPHPDCEEMTFYPRNSKVSYAQAYVGSPYFYFESKEIIKVTTPELLIYIVSLLSFYYSFNLFALSFDLVKILKKYILMYKASLILGLFLQICYHLSDYQKQAQAFDFKVRHAEIINAPPISIVFNYITPVNVHIMYSAIFVSEFSFLNQTMNLEKVSIKKGFVDWTLDKSLNMPNYKQNLHISRFQINPTTILVNVQSQLKYKTSRLMQANQPLYVFKSRSNSTIGLGSIGSMTTLFNQKVHYITVNTKRLTKCNKDENLNDQRSVQKNLAKEKFGIHERLFYSMFFENGYNVKLSKVIEKLRKLNFNFEDIVPEKCRTVKYLVYEYEKSNNVEVYPNYFEFDVFFLNHVSIDECLVLIFSGLGIWLNLSNIEVLSFLFKACFIVFNLLANIRRYVQIFN